MKRPLASKQLQGNVAKQAHTQLPPSSYEREIGQQGFYGPATHMIHPQPPTSWIDCEGPLKPRAFDLTKIAEKINPLAAQPLLSNPHLQICFWKCGAEMDYLVRNADGDLLLFLHIKHQ